MSGKTCSEHKWFDYAETLRINARIREINGEAGIRTRGTGITPYNGLANRRFQPLSHLSNLFSLHHLQRFLFCSCLPLLRL